MLDLKNLRKIVVTGGAGFLGRHVIDELVVRGAAREKILIPRSSNADLRSRQVCERIVDNADLVIHLAAKVGGIGFNQAHPGELFFDNAIMGINLIEAARIAQVGKIVIAGTICSYPRFTPVPFKEENLWNGYPEETNAPYGIAKKALLVMLQAYREQYGTNGICLLPVNLYGPHDNFDLKSSHVIPALIRKFMDAARNGIEAVEVWGDGSPTREFLYVKDAARGIVMATQSYNSSQPLNLGSSEEISIRDLAASIAAECGFGGNIVWDKARPNGQERRKLDVSRANDEFGFRAKVSLQAGLRETIEWWKTQSSARS